MESSNPCKLAEASDLRASLRPALIALAHIPGVQRVRRLVRRLWPLQRRRLRRGFWQNIILRRRRNDDHRIVELRTSWRRRPEREQRDSAGNSKGLGLHGRDPYRRLARADTPSIDITAGSETLAETVVEIRLFPPPRYGPDDVFSHSEPLARRLTIHNVADCSNASPTI
jgi:hypothetical protein